MVLKIYIYIILYILIHIYIFIFKIIYIFNTTIRIFRNDKIFYNFFLKIILFYFS